MSFDILKKDMRLAGVYQRDYKHKRGGRKQRDYKQTRGGTKAKRL